MVEIDTIPTTKESIFIDGVLFDLDLHWWKGWAQLNADDIDKEESDIPDIFKLGRKRILKHSAFNDFAKIESRARVTVEKLSYPFMISTIKFVPYSVLPEMVKELEDLKIAFYKALEVFKFYYEDNKTAFLNQYIQFRDKLKNKYPTSQEFKYLYQFNWKFFEMAIPDGIRAELVDSVKLDKVKSAWKESQNEINIQLDSWIDRVGSLMRKEILNTCISMKESLDNGKIIRESTLGRARETIKRLRTMNFIEDSQVSLLLTDLESSLPSNFNREVPEAMIGFKGTLESIISEAKDLSDVSEFTKEYKRKFIL